MFFAKHRDGESRWKAGPSDEAITSRVLAGETYLFEVLMRRHNRRVSRAIRALLNLESEVEDVMQETYVRALANLQQLRGASSLSSWLIQIAVNEALVRLRQQRKFVPLGVGIDKIEEARSGREESRAADPEEAASRGELIRLLETAVDELPPRYRLVFVLREVEGMSTRDTATALNLSKDVVKTRLRRAKLHIQRQVSSRAYSSKRGAFPFYAPRCDRVVKAVLGRIARLPNSHGIFGMDRARGAQQLNR
jgi:RNA polymerase sigma-70 factor (ECF subfamily)